MNDPEILVARIESAVFRPVRRATGYDMEQVDDFLDGLVIALRQGRSVDALIDVVRFMPTKFREGYDMEEVDAFLAEIKAASLGEQAPAPAAPPPQEEVRPAESYAAAADVVREQRGFFSRLFGR